MQQQYFFLKFLRRFIVKELTLQQSFIYIAIRSMHLYTHYLQRDRLIDYIYIYECDDVSWSSITETPPPPQTRPLRLHGPSGPHATASVGQGEDGRESPKHGHVILVTRRITWCHQLFAQADDKIFV